mgnify:CR=1 FL=1
MGSELIKQQDLFEKHNLISSVVFQFKTYVFITKRFVINLLHPIQKFSNDQKDLNLPIIASSESDLWNISDNEKNWLLTAGKVENLRVAVKRLNGIEVPANQTFSFWKQVGSPSFFKGYVKGREIREGCVIPTIAGGLCQLSNALYDTALKANFQIVERHKHTKVIQGSLAEHDRDATVKWNYVDLRFKSKFNFRIEAELTATKLIINFKSLQDKFESVDKNFIPKKPDDLNDCYSCGNFDCFTHPGKNELKQTSKLQVFILDEKWAEFDDYINSIAREQDYFILPLKKNWLIKSTRYSWRAMKMRVKTVSLFGIYRAIKLRLQAKKNNIFELSLQLDKTIAQAMVKKIPIESTHVLISQNLLPFIYQTGALGGRTFDVLMTRLPMQMMHDRLNFAHSMHPQSPTLNDYRASEQLIDLENQALTRARKIITPHTELTNIFKNKVEKLIWKTTVQISNKKQVSANKILFPASALGRKGAYEIKKLAQEFNFIPVVSGRALEHENFWGELKPEQFKGSYDDIFLVVYPTYIESQPRKILKAIAKGIPVITTLACGIEASDRVKIIELGNYSQLKKEVYEQLKTVNG